MGTPFQDSQHSTSILRPIVLHLYDLVYLRRAVVETYSPNSSISPIIHQSINQSVSRSACQLAGPSVDQSSLSLLTPACFSSSTRRDSSSSHQLTSRLSFSWSPSSSPVSHHSSKALALSLSHSFVFGDLPHTERVGFPIDLQVGCAISAPCRDILTSSPSTVPFIAVHTVANWRPPLSHRCRPTGSHRTLSQLRPASLCRWPPVSDSQLPPLDPHVLVSTG